MPRILYINNDGGGFADYVEVAEGTTVQAFFAARVAPPPGSKKDDGAKDVGQSDAA